MITPRSEKDCNQTNMSPIQKSYTISLTKITISSNRIFTFFFAYKVVSKVHKWICTLQRLVFTFHCLPVIFPKVQQDDYRVYVTDDNNNDDAYSTLPIKHHRNLEKQRLLLFICFFGWVWVLSIVHVQAISSSAGNWVLAWIPSKMQQLCCVIKSIAIPIDSRTLWSCFHHYSFDVSFLNEKGEKESH